MKPRPALTVISGGRDDSHRRPPSLAARELARALARADFAAMMRGTMTDSHDQRLTSDPSIEVAELKRRS